jgi:hypothetical protein
VRGLPNNFYKIKAGIFKKRISYPTTTDFLASAEMEHPALAVRLKTTKKTDK